MTDRMELDLTESESSFQEEEYNQVAHQLLRGVNGDETYNDDQFDQEGDDTNDDHDIDILGAKSEIVDYYLGM